MDMIPVVVCSFWVERKEFAHTGIYLETLKILDASCKRFGMAHTVMTDFETAPQIVDADMNVFATDLPRSLMKATTEVHARWLETYQPSDTNTIFVGADCLIRRDFRAELPEGDFAIAYMKDHKRWRMQNGFIYVPAASREKVATLFRAIAEDTSEVMCDDMVAIERALSPMPPDYGVHERRGLAVNFLPLPKWNRYMNHGKHRAYTMSDAAEDANVLHFMGGWEDGKSLYFEWTKAHGFA